MFGYVILFFAHGFPVVRHTRTLVPCFKFVICPNLPVSARISYAQGASGKQFTEHFSHSLILYLWHYVGHRYATCHTNCAAPPVFRVTVSGFRLCDSTVFLRPFQLLSSIVVTHMKHLCNHSLDIHLGWFRSAQYNILHVASLIMYFLLGEETSVTGWYGV
jgi:hypothetical protein